MIKKIIPLIVIVILFGCGGSDGSSKDSLNPPKEPISTETINNISKILNVPYNLVETVCMDKAFKCSGNSTIDVYSTDHLISITSDDEGYFWNGAQFTIKNNKQLDLTM
ncbi:hypothetical protein [Aliivibrio sp. 1S128]|uniref:hypothetical protein n=1 Tax=Aliivibrio sp. 1S128 TaxID=1840085 RepID=UPI00080EE514|nr:hypothetical protein [Aliivibrio sp. 1S128]OCH21187.1 hypothetical protein A6E03_19470 [Aliivibrio sp. 1S128]